MSNSGITQFVNEELELESGWIETYMITKESNTKRNIAQIVCSRDVDNLEVLTHLTSITNNLQ
ncbi:hypothetical protein A0J61_09538 [Choanephora cucurbitarum]|uniref:Uncharacterized protein n=1 Tax=Choanephora cucurbitarum TaxID=101091 RepID=A0A1C7N035_9FUNG|nr:hypothetical protein A0J61_09538 [Choanephora cucurbitarum]